MIGPTKIMFRPKHRYRHMGCLDIDIIVQTVLGENDRLISLIVKYWNRAGFPQGGRMQAVSIEKKDFWKWKWIKE